MHDFNKKKKLHLLKQVVRSGFLDERSGFILSKTDLNELLHNLLMQYSDVSTKLRANSTVLSMLLAKLWLLRMGQYW